MELSLQSAHSDILDRITLHLPLSSRLRLEATCRSMKQRVPFKRGKSELENLPPNVLHEVVRCMPSHADRLRLGAASWTLRKWAIQNGLLTLHCHRICLKEDRFVFCDEDIQQIGVLPCRDDVLPIRATAKSFLLSTDFSRVHIDQSIRRLSLFRSPLRPDKIFLTPSDTLKGRSDDPTAVRRLIEYLGGTRKPLDSLCCSAKDNETLLLEADFLHRVQVRWIHFTVSDIGPDGLDFAVESSVQEDAQLKAPPCVHIDLEEPETPRRSPSIVLDALLRFVQAHFSPNQNSRFKYDVIFKYWGAHGPTAIRALAKECGVRLESFHNKRARGLRKLTSPISTIFVGVTKATRWPTGM